ncbi:MAG: NAD(P)/FAD-dependent oxidoreductase [bacterium]
MKKYDVIVVGAGPAGSTAAYHAALAGLKVLLLEKHNQIGVPVCCAEAVTRPGLEKIVTPRPSWIATEIDQALVVGPAETTFEIEHPNAGYILERKVFDRDLAGMAAEQGTEVRVNAEAVDLLFGDHGYDGVVVEENGERKEYRAEVIIAADGVESLLGRRAEVGKRVQPKLYDSAVQYLVGGVEVNQRRMEFYFDPDLYPSGYLWVFPKGPTSANVGLGSALLGNRGPSQTDLLQQFCEKRFGNYSVLERTSGGIPCFQGKQQLLKYNLMLVGDAARVVDSFTGAGIINGMLSGLIAGQTAARFFHNGRKQDNLRDYPRDFLKLKGRELSVYLKARKVFRKLKRADLISAIEFLGAYFPERYTTGINGVHLALSLLKHNPRFILLSKEIIFG